MLRYAREYAHAESPTMFAHVDVHFDGDIRTARKTIVPCARPFEEWMYNVSSGTGFRRFQLSFVHVSAVFQKHVGVVFHGRPPGPSTSRHS